MKKKSIIGILISIAIGLSANAVFAYNMGQFINDIGDEFGEKELKILYSEYDVPGGQREGGGWDFLNYLAKRQFLSIELETRYSDRDGKEYGLLLFHEKLKELGRSHGTFGRIAKKVKNIIRTKLGVDIDNKHGNEYVGDDSLDDKGVYVHDGSQHYDYDTYAQTSSKEKKRTVSISLKQYGLLNEQIRTLENQNKRLENQNKRLRDEQRKSKRTFDKLESKCVGYEQSLRRQREEMDALEKVNNSLLSGNRNVKIAPKDSHTQNTSPYNDYNKAVMKVVLKEGFGRLGIFDFQKIAMSNSFDYGSFKDAVRERERSKRTK